MQGVSHVHTRLVNPCGIVSVKLASHCGFTWFIRVYKLAWKLANRTKKNLIALQMNFQIWFKIVQRWELSTFVFVFSNKVTRWMSPTVTVHSLRLHVGLYQSIQLHTMCKLYILYRLWHVVRNGLTKWPESLRCKTHICLTSIKPKVKPSCYSNVKTPFPCEAGWKQMDWRYICFHKIFF